jgi:DNA-binding NarL/FixJ family response regulator
VAYLRKSAVGDLDLLARTLDAAMRGAVEVTMRHDRDPERPFAGLTRGQVEMLRLVADGRTNAEIAERRGITLRAAEKAVTRAFTSLGITEATEGNPRVVAVRRFFEGAGTPIGLGDGRDPAR